MPAIRNPIEWTVDEIKLAIEALRATGHALRGSEMSKDSPLPVIRRIEIADLKAVLPDPSVDDHIYRPADVCCAIS